MTSFLKQRWAEYLFLVAAASMLLCTCTHGFHVDPDLRTNYPVIVVYQAALLACWQLACYSKRTAIAGTALTFAAAALALLVANASVETGVFDESYDNPCVFYILGFVTALFTHLMARRRALSIAYVVLGCFICALIEYLYENGLVVQMALFALAATGIVVMKTYRRAVPKIGPDDVPPHSAGLAALLACAAVVALAGGIYAVAIAPLDPPHLEVKLFTRYYALEEIHVNGQRSVEYQENPDLVSSDAEDSDLNSNISDGQTEDATGNNSTDDDIGQDDSENAGTQGSTLDGFGEALGGLKYFISWPVWLLVIGVLVLVVALSIVLKRLLRKRRYERMLRLPPAQQVVAFQRFFDQRLERFGMQRPRGLTPLEYAKANTASMAPYTDGAQYPASYVLLAESVCAVTYGNAEPDEEELLNCRNLYAVFYRNCHRQAGHIAYARKFYFI